MPVALSAHGGNGVRSFIVAFLFSVNSLDDTVLPEMLYATMKGPIRLTRCRGMTYLKPGTRGLPESKLRCHIDPRVAREASACCAQEAGTPWSKDTLWACYPISATYMARRESGSWSEHSKTLLGPGSGDKRGHGAPFRVATPATDCEE
jgi:hypothetical protein